MSTNVKWLFGFAKYVSPLTFVNDDHLMSMQVEVGDIIILASDGFFDNVYEKVSTCWVGIGFSSHMLTYKDILDRIDWILVLTL